MKIIFNLPIKWYFQQIYDELSQNYEIILPENYKNSANENTRVDLNDLENCIKQNPDAQFIFGFIGGTSLLIKWLNRKFGPPLILYTVNAIGRFNKAKESLFTKVWFVEQYAKPLMERYNRENLIYQGQAANPYIFHPIKAEKIYDIGFFGRHYAGRKYWLNLLQKFSLKTGIKYNFPQGHLRTLPWDFKDINQFYNQTKINLSFAPKSRTVRIVNLRTFEICMSGNFQLMQFTPSVEEYFEIDNEIVCWKNKNELMQKISYYLENEDEREKIAKKGYKRAIENHTWSKRFENIRRILNRKRKPEIRNFIIHTDKILESKKIKQLKSNDLNEENITIVKSILKHLGYKFKRDFTEIKSFKMCCPKFIYKPNLKNYLFIKVHSKIMMVIKVISPKTIINWNDWEHLKKIIGITENIDLTIPQFKMVFDIQNIDLSLPQFGILTNGNEWIIKDFKNKKWLKEIPNRKALKASVNSKRYLIFKMRALIYSNFKFFKFVMIIPRRSRVSTYNSILNILPRRKNFKNLFRLE